MMAMQQSRVPAAGVGAIFNPFQPSQGSPHFATAGGMAYQNTQGMASSSHAFDAAKLGEGGMRLGGGLVGSVLGSAFGPLGTMVGGYLGEKIGGAVSNLAMGGSALDASRGRQIQNMSASQMSSGGMLNPYTGTGMSREAGYQTAKGLRHLATRDHDFERQTGFNTQDVMKITQLASDQGMLLGAQSPDQITQKVKELSKTVKMLAQITGDPDVRASIKALGEMKDLGFVGTAGQAGAVANRAAFASMSGMSQAQMGQAGMTVQPRKAARRTACERSLKTSVIAGSLSVRMKSGSTGAGEAEVQGETRV